MRAGRVHLATTAAVGASPASPHVRVVGGPARAHTVRARRMARVHPTDPSPLLVTKDLCDHVMLPVHDVLPSTDEIKCMLLDNMRLPHVAALPDNRIFPIPRKGNLCELAQDDVRTVPDSTRGLHTERQIDRFGPIVITELRFIQVFLFDRSQSVANVAGLFSRAAPGLRYRVS